MTSVGSSSGSRSSGVSSSSSVGSSTGTSSTSSTRGVSSVGQDSGSSASPSPSTVSDGFETGGTSSVPTDNAADLPAAANQEVLDKQLGSQLHAAQLGAKGPTEPAESGIGANDVLQDTSDIASRVKKSAARRHDRVQRTYGDDAAETESAKRAKSATGHVANTVGGVAALADENASTLQKVKGATDLAEEGAAGVEALAKHYDKSGLADHAGIARKGLTNTGKGLSLGSNIATLADEDAGATDKLRAGTAAAKTATELVQEGAEQIAKRTAREGLEHGAKTVAKGAAKAVPVLGWAVDAAATADAAHTAYQTFNDPKASVGDKVWAGVHTATTAAGFVPVVGDAISFVGDIANIWLGRD